MVGHGTHPSYRPAVGRGHRGACLGQPIRRPVQMQQHQPARRSSEVVDPGHRLLSPVAALVQMHGRGQPVDLVGDGPVVGVDPQPRPTGRNAQRIRGPAAGRHRTGGHQRRGSVGQRGPGQEQFHRGSGTAHEATTRQRCRRCGRRSRQADSRQHVDRGGSDDPQLRQFGGGDLDLRPEDHHLQVPQQACRCGRLGVEVGHPVEFGDSEVVLDVAIGRQHKRLRARTRRQLGKQLAGQRVQPGQPIRTGHRDHTAVGKVEDRRPPLGGALLADRIAVVPGNPDIGSIGGYRAWKPEQRRAVVGIGARNGRWIGAGRCHSHHPRRGPRW